MSLGHNRSDPQLCRQCKGLCCQGHPGVWVHPDRFLQIYDLRKPLSAQSLAHQLSGHQIILREIDGVAIPSPRQNTSGCVFLDSDGCRLSERERPCQCLALIPQFETLIDGEVRCHLPASDSTAVALKNWRNFWSHC